MATITHRSTRTGATLIDGRQFARAAKSDRVQSFLDKADAYGANLLKNGRDHSRPFPSAR